MYLFIYQFIHLFILKWYYLFWFILKIVIHYELHRWGRKWPKKSYHWTKMPLGSSWSTCFKRNLALERVLSFLAFRELSFLVVSYPGAINAIFIWKHIVVSYALRIWVLGFLTLKKMSSGFLQTIFL